MAGRPTVEPTSFSTIPYELRRQIWILTFQPRFLCLHADQHAAPPSFDGKGPGGDAYRPVTVAFTLTAAEGPPSRVFRECDNHKTEPVVGVDGIGEVRGEENRECGLLPLLRSTPGPVALHVCAESRQMALERYQLAFPPTWRDMVAVNKYWNISAHGTLRGSSKAFYKSSTGEEGTWIDFQRDTVVIDRAWRPRSPDLRNFVEDPVHILALFAKKDARKIVKLAIGGDSGLGRSIHENAERRISLSTSSSVTELILDDTWHSSWP